MDAGNAVAVTSEIKVAVGSGQISMTIEEARALQAILDDLLGAVPGVAKWSKASVNDLLNGEFQFERGSPHGPFITCNGK